MQRKSQIAVFAIIGIVIIASFLLYGAYSSGFLSTKSSGAFDSSYNSFSLYATECFRAVSKDALEKFGPDRGLLQQYLKVQGVDCLNQSLFSGINLEISLPLSVELVERDKDYNIKILLKTRVYRDNFERTIDKFEFTLKKSEINISLQRNVSIGIEDFSFIQPNETKKQPFVGGEIIVHYNATPPDDSSYSSALSALHITAREPLYDLSLLGTEDSETRDIVKGLVSDEKMKFNESLISYDKLREELLRFSFIGEVSRNIVSYPGQKRFIMGFNAVSDKFYRYQWYLKNTGQFFGIAGSDISIENAWNITRGNESTVIAVIDQGISPNPDLAGNIIYSKSYNFVGKNTNITPSTIWEYHGTHVAGIIASEANNSRGIAGVCPKCRIINMRIMDGDGYADSKTLMNAVLKSVAAGAKIVSMSLGSTERSDYEELIFSQLSQKGIIFVAAAGNDGTDEKNYPAAYKGVIAVAATDNADSLSYFSNYGSWVDISAPGEFILSACGANAYCFLSGTSMATPVVSGVIGLMKSINSSLTPAQAESALKQTADPIKGSNIRINAAKALAYVSGR